MRHGDADILRTRQERNGIFIRPCAMLWSYATFGALGEIRTPDPQIRSLLELITAHYDGIPRNAIYGHLSGFLSTLPCDPVCTISMSPAYTVLTRVAVSISERRGECST